jgi:hypothetical protein
MYWVLTASPGVRLAQSGWSRTFSVGEVWRLSWRICQRPFLRDIDFQALNSVRSVCPVFWTRGRVFWTAGHCRFEGRNVKLYAAHFFASAPLITGFTSVL